MSDNEKIIVHTNARIKAIQELAQRTQQSGDNAEYTISVDGRRMWLSSAEILSVLDCLQSTFAKRLKQYNDIPTTIMTID